MRVSRRWIAPAFFVLAIGGCTESEEKEANVPERLLPDGTIRLEPANQVALDLLVEPAVEGDLPDAVLRFGRVRARAGEEALVVSPVTGRIAAAPSAGLGDTVRAGQPLVRIVAIVGSVDAVQSAQLGPQIDSAQAELKTRQAELDRDRALAKSGIVSAEKLQQSETAVAAATANLEGLRRARSVQSSGEGGTVSVAAPITGVLVSLNVNVGGVAQAGDVLARVLKAGPRWVDVSVPPDDPPGQAYEILVGTTAIPARAVSQGAVVEDDGTRHDRLEVEAAHAAKLVPGQFIRVQVARGPLHGVVVPESAIVPGVGSDSVFVETSPGTFAPRPVRIGARFGGKCRIAEGLKPGENVVTRGAMSLHGETKRGDLAVDDDD